MNPYLENIFKNCKPNYNKLEDYGFKKSNNAFIYEKNILENQFVLKVTIKSGEINAEVIDLATLEPYTLFLLKDVSGGFVGAVRSAYESVLSDIAESCFDKSVFKSDYSQKIIRYVSETYGDELEFLWKKFTDNAIWRRKDNKKWYAVILTVSKNKIGIPSDEKVEVIDLRADPLDVGHLVDNKRIFGGYHMNKKHWITICLDGSFPLDKIQKMLDVSYKLAKR